MTAPAIRFDTAQALNRLLLISDMLQRSSGPVSAGTLAIDLAEIMMRPPSKRTIERDLRLLQARGCAKPVSDGRRGATVRWCWSAGAGMLRTTA